MGAKGSGFIQYTEQNGLFDEYLADSRGVAVGYEEDICALVDSDGEGRAIEDGVCFLGIAVGVEHFDGQGLTRIGKSYGQG